MFNEDYYQQAITEIADERDAFGLSDDDDVAVSMVHWFIDSTGTSDEVSEHWEPGGDWTQAIAGAVAYIMSSDDICGTLARILTGVVIKSDLNFRPGEAVEEWAFGGELLSYEHMVDVHDRRGAAAA